MKIRFALAVLFLLFAVSCGGEEEVAAQCATADDCVSPQLCIDGACVDPDNGDTAQTCTKEEDCPFGYTCTDSHCVPIQSDTGDSGDSAQDDVADTADSVDDSEQIVQDKEEQQPDEEENIPDDTTDEDSDEVPDEDSDSGEEKCINTTECPDNQVCVASLCRDPFSVKWRIGDISVSVVHKNWEGGGLNGAPETFITLFLNNDVVFTTDPVDGQYDAYFPDHYDTYLLPDDSLRFLVKDEDPANAADTIADITVNNINPEWLHKGSYSVPPSDGVTELIIHFDLLN